MSFLLSLPGPVDLKHALEAELVRRGVSHAWVRVRAHMRDLSVKHVDIDGLARTEHHSAEVWPSVEVEGILAHGEPTRLHVRGIKASEFGYVHVAGELVSGIAAEVSVLVMPVGGGAGAVARTSDPAAAPEPNHGSKGASSLKTAARTPSAEAVRAPAPVAAAAPTTSGWGAAIQEAAQHESSSTPVAQVPRRGDQIDHFAFGRCEVVKCDGERIHLRLAKDGRVKELAMDLLKVTFLGFEPSGARRYRFERKI